MTTYAVIGVGGVGGFYGMHLARTGVQVHFLIRSGVAPGAALELASGDRNWSLQPGIDCQVHADWSDIPEVDTVIVAVKATANDEVIPRIANIVRPGGAVVIAQNGLDAEPRYAAALPDDVDVIGGLAFLASHRSSPTSFVHVDYGALTLGRYREGYRAAASSAAMVALADDLARADVPVVLTSDLLSARWQKLVWNIPFNGLSVLLDARTDALMADGAATGLVRDLMAEVVSAAHADDRELPGELLDHMIAMTRVMKPYAPSMKLDYDSGRPLEVDAMYRAPLARARRAGAAMPRTAMLADSLTFLAARRRAAD